jgi:hypothetical protein
VYESCYGEGTITTWTQIVLPSVAHHLEIQVVAIHGKNIPTPALKTQPGNNSDLPRREVQHALRSPIPDNSKPRHRDPELPEADDDNDPEWNPPSETEIRSVLFSRSPDAAPRSDQNHGETFESCMDHLDAIAMRTDRQIHQRRLSPDRLSFVNHLYTQESKHG